MFYTSSKLTIHQKVEFIEMMKKCNNANANLWNAITEQTGEGYDVTMLEEGSGLTDEQVKTCWSVSQLMAKDELYSMHRDLKTGPAARLYFKIPPDPPGGGEG